MDHIIRIECPQTGISKSERIYLLFSSIKRWIDSDELSELVTMFGGNKKINASFRERVDYLNDFAKVWDFRRKQADGGERWNIYDDRFVETHSEDIMKLSETLGLMDIVDHLVEPDYIVPLGGARRVNLIRPQYAYDISMKCRDKNPKVVALAGMRPISEIEKPYISGYAPEALTEYDAMCKGMEKSFLIEGRKYTEKSVIDANVNLSWALRKYNDMELYVLAAPTSDPDRRANSLDTFEFFTNKFQLKDRNRILLITSCIYVPFQLLKFMKIAIDNDLYIECVGNPYTDQSMLKASNYLQEIKATVNAVKSLIDEYDPESV